MYYMSTKFGVDSRVSELVLDQTISGSGHVTQFGPKLAL